MLESVLQNSYNSSMTETAVSLSLIFLHTLLVIDLLLFLVCVCVCVSIFSLHRFSEAPACTSQPYFYTVSSTLLHCDTLQGALCYLVTTRGRHH